MGCTTKCMSFLCFPPRGPCWIRADLASFPGKLQQAAETVKETKAEPTQPRRKKLADLKWMFDCVTVGLFLGGYLWDMAVDSLEL